MKKVVAIIPARFASSRFPGKPLANISGKTMIHRVFNQAMLCPVLSEVWVATDDVRIEAEVRSFGGNVVLTSPECPSGTDRCAEAIQQIGQHFDVVINIQGDEPFIQPAQISQLANLMLETGAEIGTLGKRVADSETIFNPNVVKLVKATNGKALYFSRNPIPFVRGYENKDWLGKALFFKHIGMYGYRADVLPVLTRLPVSSLEMAESLEQLRWLEAGYSVYVAETEYESFGIDTEEDLGKALINLGLNGGKSG